MYRDRRNLWRKVADLERAYGARFISFSCILKHFTDLTLKNQKDGILNFAVVHCPQAEVLWLLAAEEKWLTNNVPATLPSAFVANLESGQILVSCCQVGGGEWRVRA